MLSLIEPGPPVFRAPAGKILSVDYSKFCFCFFALIYGVTVKVNTPHRPPPDITWRVLSSRQDSVAQLIWRVRAPFGLPN